MNSKNLILAAFGTLVLVILVTLSWRGLGDGQTVEGVGTTTTSVTSTSTTQAPSGTSGTTTGQPASGKAMIETGLKEGASALNMTVTPLEVVEDSRCPRSVQCIQAGTVRVRVRVTSGIGTSEQVIALGGTMTTEAESVTLTAVSPYPDLTDISPEDYRFTFEVARR